LGAAAAARTQGAARELLAGAPTGLRYCEHVAGDGPAFRTAAYQHGTEGVVSKQADRVYLLDDRSGAWIKAKCLRRQEFVIVGWTEPKRSRSDLGALLLGYYDASGNLIYAGRVGTGMTVEELGDLLKRLKPFAVAKMPIAKLPPRETRFGSKLELSRVHWVKPKLVAEVAFSTWTEEGLLRQTVYHGLRGDKPASAVVLERPT